jgi:hypothetical protein
MKKHSDLAAVFSQTIDKSLEASQKASRFSMLATLKGTNLRRTLLSTLPLCVQVSCYS